MWVSITSLVLLATVGYAAKTGGAASAPATQESTLAGFKDNSPPPVIYSPDKTITVRTTSLCQFQRKLDGQWIGSTLASDGKVYFGSSSHSRDVAGMFFQYDPATKKVTPLSSDLSTTCGENAQTMVPQGKIHSSVVECNGYLYFSTHLAAYWKYAYDHYTGPHVLAYKLGSLEAGKPVFRDFGVVREGFTNYAGLTADPVNGYVYILVCRWWHGGGGYLYRYNLDGSGKKLLADLGPRGGQCFFMFPDKRGDVWFSHYGNFGAICKIDGKTGDLTTYPNALPMKLQLLKNESKLEPNDDPVKNEPVGPVGPRSSCGGRKSTATAAPSACTSTGASGNSMPRRCTMAMPTAPAACCTGSARTRWGWALAATRSITSSRPTPTGRGRRRQRTIT